MFDDGLDMVVQFPRAFDVKGVLEFVQLLQQCFIVRVLGDAMADQMVFGQQFSAFSKPFGNCVKDGAFQIVWNHLCQIRDGQRRHSRHHTAFRLNIPDDQFHQR